MTQAVMRASFALIASLLFVAPLLLATPTTAALAAEPEALARALSYLAMKRDDAGFQGTQITPVVEGLAYAGIDPKTWPSPERNAFDLLVPYPSSNGPYYSYLRIAYAAAISGYDPRDVHGEDYVQKVRDGYVAAQFGNVSFNNDDVWAVLALRAAGVPRDDAMIRQAVQNIQAARALDGGWSHTAVATAADVDSTGMALLALAHAGEDLAGDKRARDFLTSLQGTNGGFHAKKSVPDPRCQSTVWALHGLNALGQPPPPSALHFLMSLQNADGGFGPTLQANGQPSASDAFCTAEVLAILAGTVTPRLSHAPVHVEQEVTLRAGATTTLRVAATFTNVTWNISGTILDGNKVRLTFAEKGTYPFEVFARAENFRGRYHGALTVAGSPPSLAFASIPTTTLRHTPVTVDARTSSDLDGTLSRLEVNWGDGNTSSESGLLATHKYATPGERVVTVRILDDDGLDSTTSHVLTVVNRAPTFAAWTPGAVVKRTQPALPLPTASDADGDPVFVQWTVGNLSDTTPTAPTPTIVGPATVTMIARDTYGAQAWANVTFEVVNLAPTLANLSLPAEPLAGAPFTYNVEVQDADGPSPSVVWHWTHDKVNRTEATPNGTLTLTAGLWTVSVTATDADGASTRVSRTLTVHPVKARAAGEDAAAQEPSRATNRTETEAPRIENLTTSVQEGAFKVTFDATPEHATRIIHWQTDDATGTANVTGGAWQLPLENGHWARVRVEVLSAGESASAESAVTHAPPRPPLAKTVLSLTPDPAMAGVPLTISVDSEATLLRVRFDSGDGLTRVTNTSNLTHTYASPGTYSISIWVESADGRTAQVTRTLVVEANAQPPAAATSREGSTVVRIESHSGGPDAFGAASDAEAIAPTPEARQTPAAPLALVVAAFGLLAIARGKRRA